MRIFPNCDLLRWEVSNSVQLANAENYYTKTEVDNLIGDISGMTSGDVQTLIDDSLDNYYTKEEVDALTSGASIAPMYMEFGVSYDIDEVLEHIENGGEVYYNDEGYYIKMSKYLNSSISFIHTDIDSESQTMTVRQIVYRPYADDQWVTTEADYTSSYNLSNDYYDKTEVDAALDLKANTSAVTALSESVEELSTTVSSKADTSAVTTVSDALTAHTADTTVHVTSAEKTSWNGAASDASDALTALGGLSLVSLTEAEYDALTTKDASTIYFING